MKTKKTPIIVGVVLALAVLLTPVCMTFKDGGSVCYKSLLYEAKKIHSISHDTESGFIEGFEFKILGMTVYRHTNEK